MTPNPPADLPADAAPAHAGAPTYSDPAPLGALPAQSPGPASHSTLAPIDELVLSGQDHFLTEADLRDGGASADDDDAEHRRGLLRPIVLFVVTCVTTFYAGVFHWNATLLTFNAFTTSMVERFWRDGLVYMIGVMGILLAHEMGHFLMTVHYRIRSSYPMFIPFPVMLSGTMGAVIGMEGSKADRRQLFDIGLAGPLAGLVVIVPLLWVGIYHAPVWHGGYRPPIGDPLLVKLLTAVIRPDLTAGQRLDINAPMMAAWVGLMITGLNMLPISQLDGGHVSHAVLGRWSRGLASLLLIGSMAFIVIAEEYNWSIMVILVTLLGVHHPPTANDDAPLGRVRWTIGLLSLLIPVFCFTPWPFQV